MKIIILSVILCMNVVRFTASKKYLVLVGDELLPNELAKNADHFTKYFSIDNLNMESLDDNYVEISGYVVWLQSLNPNVPMEMRIRTEYFENSKWKEGSFRIDIKDLCPDFLNTERYWYNITKLWKSNVCPPKKGDKWEIEQQIVTMVNDLPAGIPLVPWKSNMLLTQGLPGMETVQIGVSIRIDLELM